eukprot:4946486-Alexandrium_andersonii.AAC.1
MSASLVGSEMCIRDSALLPAAARAAALARGGVDVLNQRAGKHVLRRPPVSYTHLTLPTICSV